MVGFVLLVPKGVSFNELAGTKPRSASAKVSGRLVFRCVLPSFGGRGFVLKVLSGELAGLAGGDRDDVMMGVFALFSSLAPPRCVVPLGWAHPGRGPVA